MLEEQRQAQFQERQQALKPGIEHSLTIKKLCQELQFQPSELRKKSILQTFLNQRKKLNLITGEHTFENWLTRFLDLNLDSQNDKDLLLAHFCRNDKNTLITCSLTPAEQLQVIDHLIKSGANPHQVFTSDYVNSLNVGRNFYQTAIFLYPTFGSKLLLSLFDLLFEARVDLFHLDKKGDGWPAYIYCCLFCHANNRSIFLKNPRFPIVNWFVETGQLEPEHLLRMLSNLIQNIHLDKNSPVWQQDFFECVTLLIEAGAELPADQSLFKNVLPIFTEVEWIDKFILYVIQKARPIDLIVNLQSQFLTWVKKNILISPNNFQLLREHGMIFSDGEDWTKLFLDSLLADQPTVCDYLLQFQDPIRVPYHQFLKKIAQQGKYQYLKNYRLYTLDQLEVDAQDPLATKVLVTYRYSLSLEELRASRTGNYYTHECPICFEELTGIIEGCSSKHFHHQSCLEHWYKNSVNSGCPLCRQKVSKDLEESHVYRVLDGTGKNVPSKTIES